MRQRLAAWPFLVLIASVAPVSADVPYVGKIDLIGLKTIVEHQKAATHVTHTLTYGACRLTGDNTCWLSEDDMLNVQQEGSVTFTIFNSRLTWTCTAQNKIQIHAVTSQWPNCSSIKYRDATVGSAEWKAVYRPGESDPKSVSALVIGGQMLEKAGEYAEAREQYRQAQHIQPKSGWIQHEMDRMEAMAQQSHDGPRPTPRKLALVIGISEYLWHPGLQLDGGAADALWFAAYLSSPKGGALREESDMTKLTDERATIAAIRRSAKDVLRMKARPGDTVFVYISGHAVRMAQEAFLVGYDSRLEEPRTLYPLDELRRMSQDASRLGVRVILFADVCHAGALQKLKRSGGTKIPPPLDGRYFGEGGVWGIAASGLNEFSKEQPLEGHNGHVHGIFTRCLMEGLYSSADRISNAALWSYINERLANDSGPHNQHPLQIGAGMRTFFLSEAGPEQIVPDDSQPGPRGLERFIEGQARREWARLSDGVGEESSQPLARFSTRLEGAGDALLNEYLSGEEIPQSAADFRVGAEIYAVLGEMASSGKVAKDPQLIEARRSFFEAMALLREGGKSTAPRAVKLLEEALQWDDNAGYIYNALGQARARAAAAKATLEDAAAAFEDAILLDPDWPYARHNLAVIHEVQSEDEKAAKLYEQAIERAVMLGKTPASSYYSLGRLLHARSDFPSARYYYRSAQKAFSSLTRMYQDLAGRCHGEACSAAYDRIVSGYRIGEAQAWNALGILEHDDHRDARAIKDLEYGRDLLADRVDEERRVRSDIRFNLVKVKILKSKSGEGQRLIDLRELIDKDPNYAPAIFELALLHQHENPGIKEAEVEFTRVSELEPQALQGWQGLVEVLVVQGRRSEAEGVLHRAKEHLDQDSFGELRRALDAAFARQAQ